MKQLKRSTWILLVLAMMLVVSLLSAAGGAKLGSRYARNIQCCDMPRYRNIWLSVREELGFATFYSQIGQDKWVLEKVFPGVKDGFFLDVGSADGTRLSNTKALEERGWTGLCIDPFPTNMQGRSCQMVKEVVFSKAGVRMTFQASGDVGGITDTLGLWKGRAMQAPSVELTTTTLRDILERNKAPRYIHFISLDIEGAELEALKGFPFDTHKVGAFAIEHNFEEPKRTQIHELLRQQGYKHAHAWEQDDFFVPEGG